MLKRMMSVLPLLLLAAPTASFASDQLFPAGSIISCSVAEGKISSKTTALGDPVLCTLNPVEKYGRSVFPYGSYLEGRFEAYQDPGHFVGKGWMELRFDKLIMGNRVVPISAKVVQTPGYRVDADGRILGNGHATKDTVTWLIPVLWPIDLINLPRRGPSPVLKPETRLTLELMDDLGVMQQDDQQVAQPVQRAALIERQSPQQVYEPAPVQQAAPQQVYYQTFQAPQQQAYQPPQQQQQQTVVVQQQPAYQGPPVYRYPAPPPVYYYPPAYRYYPPAY
jgi:hypothetical protein